MACPETPPVPLPAPVGVVARAGGCLRGRPRGRRAGAPVADVADAVADAVAPAADAVALVADVAGASSMGATSRVSRVSRISRISRVSRVGAARKLRHQLQNIRGAQIDHRPRGRPANGARRQTDQGS